MRRMGFDPLLLALDRAAAPVNFFVRDDDAGWADERLLALLRVMDAANVPIDLAAIPAALTLPLARELKARRGAGQGIGIHQHGYAHANHEPAGRKCEFGPARSLSQCESDLRRGREQLLDLLGECLDPIFTPPWNRLGPDTPALLGRLGFSALSRDFNASPQGAIAEISVHCDWTKQWRLANAQQTGAREPIALACVARELARHASAGACVGLMLHHEAMSDSELAALSQGLARWTGHPNARWRQMREL
ncbi:MAG: hypothetical protein WA210_09365 [Burkholderiaceae bacterium]